MFTVAKDAIANHPELKKVILMEHAPRFDTTDMDPLGLKQKLALYANKLYKEMLNHSDMKNKTMIGNHKLDCVGDQRLGRYTDEVTGRYDGVHHNNSFGKRAYTRSVLGIIASALPLSSDDRRTPSSSTKNTFSVPVNNRFNVLGN